MEGNTGILGTGDVYIYMNLFKAKTHLKCPMGLPLPSVAACMKWKIKYFPGGNQCIV